MEDEWRGEWEKRRKMSGDERRSRIAEEDLEGER